VLHPQLQLVLLLMMLMMTVRMGRQMSGLLLLLSAQRAC
jgi:hypothetical protein